MPVGRTYKLKCPKCGYSKVVHQQSDVISPLDLINGSTTCPKCGKEMKEEKLNLLDMLFR